MRTNHMFFYVIRSDHRIRRIQGTSTTLATGGVINMNPDSESKYRIVTYDYHFIEYT
jgi:hypothetical protein